MIMPTSPAPWPPISTAQPPRAQNQFANRAGIHRSKICRLLKGTISSDRDELDKILGGGAGSQSPTILVTAYIRNLASPGALLHLKPTP